MSIEISREKGNEMRNIHFMSRTLLLSIVASFVVASVPLAFAKDAPADKSQEKAKWESLFDGKTLGKWVSTNFGGEGEVRVEDGAITLDAGASLTGINYTGPVLKTNYEISLDAQRIQGTDFFCGLTVPVGDSYASLIVGGWGGSLCGISSIDDKDAARNDTRTIRAFKSEKWYHIRFRVYADRLQAWIDNERIVDVSIAGHKVSLRAEVLPSRPLGISAYQTTAGLKNIQMRKLTPKEIASEKK